MTSLSENQVRVLKETVAAQRIITIVEEEPLLANAMVNNATITPTLEDKTTTGTPATSFYYKKPEGADDYMLDGGTSYNDDLFLAQVLPLPTDSSEGVANILNETDGLVIVQDVLSDEISKSTGDILAQSLRKYVRPTLFLDNFDRAVFDLGMGQEELYELLFDKLERLNVIIASNYNDDGVMGTGIQFNPGLNPIRVVFGSTTLGFAFSNSHLAEIYAARFKVSPMKLAKKFWGDWFFNTRENQWYKIGDSESQRGFNLFVLDPIYMMHKHIMDGEKDKAMRLADKLGISLTKAEQELEQKALVQAVMKRWLPLDQALSPLIITQLPSPVTASKYRS